MESRGSSNTLSTEVHRHGRGVRFVHKEEAVRLMVWDWVLWQRAGARCHSTHPEELAEGEDG